MAYLSFEFDALDLVPNVARVAGISESEVAYGLLHLWRYAFREKTDSITRTHLAGFFPGDHGRVLTALETFGFIALPVDGVVRVRGAERYLRVSEAKRKGGKARAANATRAGGKLAAAGDSTSRPPAYAGEVLASAGEPHQQPPALTANSEQRTANLKAEAVVAPPLPPKKPDDPFTSGAAYFAHIQHERMEGGLAREKPPHPNKLSSWWSEALMELNGDAKSLDDAFSDFTKDPYWKQTSPPFPFSAFMSQWRNYVPVRR